MRTKYSLYLLFLVTFFFLKAEAASDAPLKIAVLSTTDQQTLAYTKMISQFEVSTGVKVDIHVYSDVNFKKKLPGWIELGNYDVLYGRAGQRLNKLVANQEIVPLSEFINVDEIEQQYLASALDAVRYQNHIYALPLGHYIWGFYYNKSIFKQLELSPPNTWDEFKLLNQRLQQSGVTPLIQATADSWPTLAWLDYLSVKIAGTNFRDAIITGETGNQADFNSLIDVFRYLVSNDLFFAPEHSWRWQQIIPAVERKQAAMTLSGQFVEQQIKQIDDANIGFFPFPNFQRGHDDIAVVPMEVLIIPSSTNQHAQVSKLMQFLVSYMAVDSLADDLGWLSVSKQPVQKETLSTRVSQAQMQIQNATQLVHYFNRDAEPNISQAWANAIITDIRNGNTDSIAEIQTRIQMSNTQASVDMVDDERLMNFSSLPGKGTYYFSRIMDSVYDSLGYKTVISRFASSEAVIKSLGFGADGDLVRVVNIPQLNLVAIKVPEPIIHARLYLVGGQGQSCELDGTKLPPGSSLAYGVDAHIFSTVAKQLKPESTTLTTLVEAWTGLYSGEFSHLLVFETDLYNKRDKLDSFCFETLQRIPGHHYLANKHIDLVDKVNNAIKQFKKTIDYKAITAEFGIGVLPDSQ
ncbi:ABC transporter substrate-binding protein [Aliiglaciecola litoralis]|uniref:Carbohydrate ABC transporter substrate-binding protein, CUT1 family n=1 Tax=Aliiglaciecola litoralis TaxID=582857 RepID=A0ABN1LEE4_9ALTE